MRRAWLLSPLLSALTALTAAPALAVTFEVTSTADGNGACDAAECTLREAITAANGTPAPDRVVFAGDGGGVFMPASPLPVVTAPLELDGAASPNGAVVLAGGLPGVQHGLQADSPGVVVRQFVVVGFDGAGVATPPGAPGVRLERTTTKDNGGLGIDLGSDGVTTTGAPVLTQATRTALGTTLVRGTLAVPAGSYRVDVYANGDCDPSGHGEGEAFWGTADVTSPGGAPTPFEVVAAPTSDEEVLTATVTSLAPGGGTSEYSACMTSTPGGGEPPPAGGDGGDGSADPPPAPPAPPSTPGPPTPPAPLAPLVAPRAPSSSAAPPTLGRTVNARAERGVVTVTLPGGRKVALDDLASIPAGATVDATKGAVRLQTAPGAGGRPGDAVFSEGTFRLAQARDGLTTLTLAGALPACAVGKGRARAAGAAARARKGSGKRRLWGDGKGRFRVSGRHSASVVRGTVWLVEDTCAGTLTRVERGVVAVEDFAAKKTVTLRAGGRYLAKPRARRGR